MILTLTPNPSLDLLFSADQLVWDDANRVPMPRRRPGGQGVNVVRAIRSLDPEASIRALIPLGGAIGRELEQILSLEGTPLTAVSIPGETRVFVGARDRTADRSLLLNPRGPEVDAAAEADLLSALLQALDEAPPPSRGRGSARWLACCGSLLPGLSADLYARAGKAARERGWSFVPDCDGEALRLAVAAGADLLVPNLHEAERLLGRPIRGVVEAAGAARGLLELGPSLAFITMAAEGAVAATPRGCWHARIAAPPELRSELAEGSAVGAGDAFLAALLLALGNGLTGPDALSRATVAGGAALLSRGDDLVDLTGIDRVAPHVRVDPIEPYPG